MASAISANRAELLAIATSVATEKMIDRAIVIEAMEEAIQKSARSRYGAENDIRAKLDPRTGDLRLWRVVEVVEEVEDYFKQVDLKAAEKLQPGAKLGDFIVDPLPPVDLGRILGGREALVQRKPVADFGSNENEFWYWISQDNPPYLYHCNYSDLSQGNVKLPFPFQPDWVLEVVGAPGVIPDGIGFLNNGGTLLEVGNIGTGRTFELDPSVLVYGNKSVRGVMLYDPATLAIGLSFLQ